MRGKRVIGSIILFLSLLGSIPPESGETKGMTGKAAYEPPNGESRPPLIQLAQKSEEKAIIDELFKKILGQGFVITLATANELKARAEQQEAEQVVLDVPVTIKASEGIQAAIDKTAHDLGGLSLDAVLELDYGMVRLQAHAVRVSSDPQTLEYLQRRVGSLVFILELVLDNGESYECSTRDIWRFPITPVSQLFAYGGRPTIQGLGISPEFGTKDNGFIATRKKPIAFIYKALIQETDLKRLTKVQGKMIERKGSETEGRCRKTGKTASG
ncbi:MAG TPA: hypothetical protein VFL31_01860 [Nitrospiraceae bacterium]|nr:hypothetical protein [Nitrospiraceae bacterium]